jgi:YVTN family beta-propeller protein
VVNSASGQVVGTNISVGTDPVAMAAVYPDSVASGQVLVLNQGSDNVSVISTSTNLVTATIALPSGATPVSIAVDATHYYALVVDTFSTQSSDEVTVISTVSDSVVGSFSLGLSNSSGTPGQIAVLPGGSYAYVTDQTSHEVIALENISTSPYYQLESALSYTGSSSFDPVAISAAASGSTVYVSDVGGTGYVDYFPVIFGSLSSESSISLSLTPGALSMSFSGSTLYVQIPGSSKVDYVNTTSDTATTETTAVTAGPVAIADGGDLLAVGDTASSDVELVNSSIATEQSDVSLVGSPTAILSLYPEDVHFDAYVANYGSGTVSVLDLQADAVRQTLTVGTDPDAIATSPGGTKVYVANYGSGTVSVISTADIGTATNPVVATVSLPSGSDPSALVVAPNADRLLVVDEGTGEVSVVDTNPNDGSSYDTVVATIYLDGAGTADAALDADGIAFGPDGTYAYVTDSGDKAVTVLSETSANTYGYDALQTFSSFTTPDSIVISPNDQTAYVTDSLGSSTAGKLWEFPVYATGASIGQLNTSSGTSLTVGKAPDGLSLSPEGQTAYVADASSATVSVVNTATSGVSSESATGAPGGVGATPDGSMYVESGGSGSNSVSVYSASSYSSLANISVGTTPGAIAVSPTLQTPAAGAVSPSEIAGGGSNPSEAAVAQGSADIEAGGDTSPRPTTPTPRRRAGRSDTAGPSPTG